MDWKDHLASLIGDLPQDDRNEDTESEEISKSVPAGGKKQVLYIRFEKRNGKPATIVSEFEGSDDERKSLAKRLKSNLGVGGSDKDDEILLQGDVRHKVCELLRAEGFRLKGEVR